MPEAHDHDDSRDEEQLRDEDAGHRCPEPEVLVPLHGMLVVIIDIELQEINAESNCCSAGVSREEGSPTVRICTDVDLWDMR